jgi:hypothetical protein
MTPTDEMTALLKVAVDQVDRVFDRKKFAVVLIVCDREPSGGGLNGSPGVMTNIGRGLTRGLLEHVARTVCEAEGFRHEPGKGSEA